jgi:FMN-dependent NADH-azoreductase
MDKTPTAEEIYQEITKRRIFDMYNPNIKKAMIEFAKIHVEAALKEASEKAFVTYSEYTGDEIVSKNSILKSYPLTNIK